MHKEFSEYPFLLHLTIAIIGGVGGIVKGLSVGQRKLIDLVIGFTISSFTGVMFGYAAMLIFGDTHLYMTLICSGSGGFLGTEGMKALSEAIKRKTIDGVK